MKCMNCGQREAEIFIKQVVNQEVCDLNLCRQCAVKLGHVDKAVPSITISFSLRQLPADTAKLAEQIEDVRQDVLVCPECGLTFAEFRKTGRLGCAGCYAAFRFPLGDFFQKYHGAESHWVGSSGVFDDLPTVKQPETPAVFEDIALPEFDSRIFDLRCELDDALNHEEYERASKIRDAIKAIESEAGHADS